MQATWILYLPLRKCFFNTRPTEAVKSLFAAELAAFHQIRLQDVALNLVLLVELICLLKIASTSNHLGSGVKRRNTVFQNNHLANLVKMLPAKQFEKKRQKYLHTSIKFVCTKNTDLWTWICVFLWFSRCKNRIWSISVPHIWRTYYH